ncbi:MAG TPA: hypothetical protein VF848_02095 [Steroidobacteraceae bacterium]
MVTKKPRQLILVGLSMMATLALAQSDMPGGVPAASRDISAIKPGTAKPAPKHGTKHKKAKPAASTPIPAK